MFNIAEIIRATLKNKGLSINIKGENPISGYMVALRGREVAVEKSKPLSSLIDTLQKFISDNEFDLSQKHHYLGTWIYNGKIYIDIAFNYQDLNTSIDMAYLSKQISIYDVKNKEVIYTSFERITNQTPLESTTFYQWLKEHGSGKNATEAIRAFTNLQFPLRGRPDTNEYLEVYKVFTGRYNTLMSIGRFL